MYILSQILIVLSDLACILSMMSKKKKQIVFFLIISTILFASHYLCLKAWTGAAIGFVELVFLIVMYILELKDKTKYNIYLSIATMIVTVVLSILTWETWISVLPMLAMVIYLTAMIFKNVIIVKSGAFIRLTLNGVYMLLIKSYFGAGFSVLILIFTIVGIVIDYKSKKKTEEGLKNESLNEEISEEDLKNESPTEEISEGSKKEENPKEVNSK